jgi:hypothetical protein
MKKVLYYFGCSMRLRGRMRDPSRCDVGLWSWEGLETGVREGVFVRPGKPDWADGL